LGSRTSEILGGTGSGRNNGYSLRKKASQEGKFQERLNRRIFKPEEKVVV